MVVLLAWEWETGVDVEVLRANRICRLCASNERLKERRTCNIADYMTKVI